MNIRVVNTRALKQSEHFIRSLQGFGFKILSFPLIEVEVLPRTPVVDAAIYRLESGFYSHLVFTSANGVNSFKSLLVLSGSSPDIFSKVTCIVQGAATGLALKEAFGIDRFLIPRGTRSEDLAEELIERLNLDTRILLVGAEDTRAVIDSRLNVCGHNFDRIRIYRTKKSCLNAEQIKILENVQNIIQVICFFSPSAWQAFLQLENARKIVENSVIASIGPVTSQAIQASGYNVQFEADQPSSQSMTSSLVGYLVEYYELDIAR